MVLKFDVAGRILAKLTVRAVFIMGGEAMLPPDRDAHRTLYDGILNHLRWADCLYMPSLPCDGYAWEYLSDRENAPRGFIPYVARGQINNWRVLALGQSYQHYVDSLRSKTRSNLRRKARMLRDYAGGRLVLRRFESVDEVDEFLECAVPVSTRSWQHRLLGPRTDALNAADLMSFARAQILRSYVLWCGDDACAFVLGTQLEGVYHSMEMGFDEAYGALKLSPGIVLLDLIIEDLFRDRAPEYFNFGVGDGTHKQLFTNIEMKDAAMFLFRRNLANRLRIAAHRGFHAGLVRAKQLLRRKRPMPLEGGAPAVESSPS
jgi:hypothetical protein